MDGKDIRMRERSHGLGFALEPRPSVGILRERIRQDFHRDLSFQTSVASPIHLSHAAYAKGRENLIRAKPGRDCQHKETLLIAETKSAELCEFKLRCVLPGSGFRVGNIRPHPMRVLSMRQTSPSNAAEHLLERAVK
jgi:hypothetical protein